MQIKKGTGKKSGKYKICFMYKNINLFENEKMNDMSKKRKKLRLWDENDSLFYIFVWHQHVNMQLVNLAVLEYFCDFLLALILFMEGNI
jgi:hypothetical protein